MPASYTDLLGSEILLHYDVSDSSTLFTDEACTSAASDGNEVKGVTSQSDAALSPNMTGANGPTYRANYAASGYAALEFDGVNDRLGNATTGLLAERFFVLAAYTPISGADETIWCRGSIAGPFVRFLYIGTGALQSYVQTRESGSVYSFQLPTGVSSKVVVVVEAANELTQVSSGTSTYGKATDAIDASLTEKFYFGAGENSGIYQPANAAIHEIMLVGKNAEFGQVVRASTIMRDKWGVADNNALPVVSGGAVLNRGIMSGGSL